MTSINKQSLKEGLVGFAGLGDSPSADIWLGIRHVRQTPLPWRRGVAWFCGFVANGSRLPMSLEVPGITLEGDGPWPMTTCLKLPYTTFGPWKGRIRQDSWGGGNVIFPKAPQSFLVILRVPHCPFKNNPPQNEPYNLTTGDVNVWSQKILDSQPFADDQ